MDKITKVLRKLSEKECAHVEQILTLLLAGKTASLDIKKLQGAEDVYRVRVGTLRIIFRKQKPDILILEISRRDEGTYHRY